MGVIGVGRPHAAAGAWTRWLVLAALGVLVVGAVVQSRCPGPSVPPSEFWIREGDSRLHDRPAGEVICSDWVVALVRSDTIGDTIGILSSARTMTTLVWDARYRLGLYRRGELRDEEVHGTVRYRLVRRELHDGVAWTLCR
ncbi:MAG: hypothetical protein K8T90_08615 [Planctomycetes bacterium]|nr:hypothetical protein [Planctomycetota bacterium]